MTSINRRFESKESLWQATVDRWFGELVDALAPSANLDGAGNPLDRLREFVVTFSRSTPADPRWHG